MLTTSILKDAACRSLRGVIREPSRLFDPESNDFGIGRADIAVLVHPCADDEP